MTVLYLEYFIIEAAVVQDHMSMLKPFFSFCVYANVSKGPTAQITKHLSGLGVYVRLFLLLSRFGCGLSSFASCSYYVQWSKATAREFAMVRVLSHLPVGK
jgi:hypothetical protein